VEVESYCYVSGAVMARETWCRFYPDVCKSIFMIQYFISFKLHKCKYNIHCQLFRMITFQLFSRFGSLEENKDVRKHVRTKSKTGIHTAPDYLGKPLCPLNKQLTNAAPTDRIAKRFASFFAHTN
jgi:hypothetical protein